MVSFCEKVSERVNKVVNASKLYMVSLYSSIRTCVVGKTALVISKYNKVSESSDVISKTSNVKGNSSDVISKTSNVKGNLSATDLHNLPSKLDNDKTYTEQPINFEYAALGADLPVKLNTVNTRDKWDAMICNYGLPSLKQICNRDNFLLMTNTVQLKVSLYSNVVSDKVGIYLPDKLRVALFVTWMWAKAGLLVTKSFEQMFKNILRMPDNWLALPINDVKNTTGKNVKILLATDGKTNITNKLKLFMKLYWEQGGPNDACETNGFDFAKYSKILNCSMLYCCYLLTDKDGNINPEEFWKSANKFLVEQTDKKCVRYKNHSRVDVDELYLRNVDFEENTISDGVSGSIVDNLALNVVSMSSSVGDVVSMSSSVGDVVSMSSK
jgi:hypothetical protein